MALPNDSALSPVQFYTHLGRLELERNRLARDVVGETNAFQA